jgi:hypothetical protein
MFKFFSKNENMKNEKKGKEKTKISRKKKQERQPAGKTAKKKENQNPYEQRINGPAQNNRPHEH